MLTQWCLVPESFWSSDLAVNKQASNSGGFGTALSKNGQLGGSVVGVGPAKAVHMLHFLRIYQAICVVSDGFTSPQGRRWAAWTLY